MTDKVTERVPLWLAVAIVVVISIPYGTLLGTFSIALWAAFISWAEYFAFGSEQNQLKWIYGLFTLGALAMVPFAIANNYIVEKIGFDLIISSTFLLSIIVAIAIYALSVIPNGMEKSLAYFNGVSMFLALYFAGIPGGPGTGGGPLINSDLAWAINPVIHWFWISVAGVFGGFLGWFNIQIMFPTVEGGTVEKELWEWIGIITTVLISVLLFILYHPWTGLVEATRTQYMAFICLILLVALSIGWKATQIEG